MSLIHEALRKARHEAARDDDAGVIYARGLTGRRPQRNLGVGIIVGIGLTIAVATILGGSLWWVLRGRSPDRLTEASVVNPILEENEAATESYLTENRNPDTPGGSDSPASEPAALADRPSNPPDGDPAADLDSADSGNRTMTFTEPTRVSESASANREFVAEADLGYTSLSLDYIVFRPVDPFAQINGFDVRVGSSVEGFVVEEITAESVRLRDGKGTLVLRAE